jgi:hypothetical protein
MKRVLAIVLGLCLLSGLSVNADIDTIEGSTIAGGASCDTITDTCAGSSGASAQTFGNSSTVKYYSFMFTADETGTLCEGTVRLIYINGGTGSSETVELCIYSDTAGTPDGDGQIGSCSDPVAISSIDTSNDDVVFSNISAPGITATTSYHGVLVVSGVDTDDYPRLVTYTDCSPERLHRDSDGLGFTLTTSSASAYYTLKVN